MEDRSRRGRIILPAAFAICVGFFVLGCAKEGVEPPTEVSAETGAGPAAPSTLAAALPAKTPPEPTLYTETICKVRNGRALPPTVAGSAYNCLRDKMKYAKSGHPLAEQFQSWSRLDSAPFLSKVHGNRYVAVYANDRALTTLSADAAAPIHSGVALATPTFSLTEDGTLEPGPLFILEKMQKGFSTTSGNWRYTLIGPEGDIIGVTKGQHGEDITFCADCSRKSADAVYLALLRGQTPPEIVTRSAQQSFDPSKERIDPTMPILDPNAPLQGGGAGLPAAVLNAPPIPSAAPIAPVGGPVGVSGPATSVLDPTALVSDPTAPVLDPTQPALDPTAPVLDPAKPALNPASAVLDPTKTVLDPGTPPSAATAPALDPNAPIIAPPSGPTFTAPTGPVLTPQARLGKSPDPTLPILDPNAPPPNPASSALTSPTPTVALPGTLLDPEAPIGEQSMGPAPEAERPITEESVPSVPANAPALPIGAAPLLDPDVPVTAQANPFATPKVPAATAPAPAPGAAPLLDPDAPVTAQANPFVPPKAPAAAAPAPVPPPGAAPLLDPDAPITAGSGPIAGLAPAPAPTQGRAAAPRPTRQPALSGTSRKGNLADPELPIQDQEISGYFK